MVAAKVQGTFPECRPPGRGITMIRRQAGGNPRTSGREHAREVNLETLQVRRGQHISGFGGEFLWTSEAPLPSLRPVLEALVAEGFRISPALIESSP
jgi:hypothetical protein